MDSWDPQVNEIFARAAQIDSAGEREAFLDQACGANKALREAVEALLASHRKAGSFLEQPATGIDRTIDVDPRSLDAGLAATFGSDAAVVIGDAGHSVLKSLGKNLTRVPRVMLPNAGGTESSVDQSKSGSRYQMEGEIARGGMGAVLKGRDTDLGRDLAIKVLLDSHRDNPDVVARFIEEAQIGGQLQHPGIVPVHELGQFADERPFFSMKLVKGKTLASLLRQRKDPSEDRPKFLSIFEQICQTMAYAHSRQVIHRDLKPANIMVGAFGEVQVMDWGLAKVLGDEESVSGEEIESTEHGTDVVQTLRSSDSDAANDPASKTQMGSVMGTPAYMPPEQALGKINRLDERADVFGLGAILCEILTGQPPYAGEDGAEVYRQAASAELGSCFARLEVSDVDAELAELVKESLTADPEQRLRDAGVLAERTTNHLAGVQERLKAAELAKAKAQARAEEERRRRKLQFAIAGMILLVAVGTGIAATRFRRLANKNMALAEASRRQLYLSDMNVALQDWRDGKLRRVVAALKRHEPQEHQEDLRRYEWYHLWDLCREPLGSPTFRHGDSCFAIAFSPDGTMLVSSGHKDVRLWDVSNRQEKARLPSDENYVWYVAFSPDGNRIAAANHGNNVKVWDVKTLELEHRFPHEEGARCVAFSPGAETLASCGVSGDVHLWDVVTGDKVMTLSTGSWAPAVTFSSDGTYLASGSINGVIKLWRLPSGTELNGFTVDGAVESIDISPDNGALAVRHGRMVTLWDVETNEARLITKDAGSLAPRPVRFSPDGRMLVYDGAPNTVKLWEIAGNKELRTITHGSGVNAVDVSPNGKSLASGSNDGAVKFWDLADGQAASTLAAHSDKVGALSFSPDGKLLASGGSDGAVKLWNTATWAVEHAISQAGQVLSLEFSPDGSTLAFSKGGLPVGEINVVETKSLDTRYTLAGHPNATWSVEFSPDGRYLASAGEKGYAKVWDLQRGGREVSSGQVDSGAGAVRKVAFFPDGTKLASASSRTTKFWGLARGKLQPLEAHTDDLAGTWSFAFSPDGKTLASGSSGGNLILWDVQTRRQVKAFPDAGWITSIAFSPEGKTLVSVDNDVVRLWDIGRQVERVQFRAPAVVWCVAFSPDGRTIVGGLLDGSLQIWRAATEGDVRGADWWTSFDQP